MRTIEVRTPFLKLFTGVTPGVLHSAIAAEWSERLREFQESLNDVAKIVASWEKSIHNRAAFCGRVVVAMEDNLNSVLPTQIEDYRERIREVRRHGDRTAEYYHEEHRRSMINIENCQGRLDLMVSSVSIIYNACIAQDMLLEEDSLDLLQRLAINIERQYSSMIDKLDALSISSKTFAVEFFRNPDVFEYATGGEVGLEFGARAAR